MSAIGLRFDVNKRSERLHQLVLAALFSRTLLLNLLGFPGRYRPEVEWEPLGGLFDLAVPSKDPDGHRAYVEIKVDAIPSGRQWQRQLSRVEQSSEPGRVLYLLLGVSEIAYSRDDVEQAVKAVGGAVVTSRESWWTR